MKSLPKTRKAVQKPSKTILSRTLFLLVVCGVLSFIVLAVRLFNVQIVNHDTYQQQALEQQTREVKVTASRGTIYDAKGNILAMSASAETVYINPYEINLYKENPSLIAQGLSDILGVDYNTILQKTTDTKSYYKLVKAKIEEDVANKVRAFISQNKLKSIHIETDTKRYYPYGSLASHVMGFVGDDNYGLNGIEAEYDSYLTGVNGSVIRLKNAKGTNMLFTNFEDYLDAEDGNNVTLTIDTTIQYYAEKYLKQAIADNAVQNGGSCIIMNVKTGEILAMASMQNYDPNNFQAVNDDVKAELSKITDQTEYNKALVAAQNKQWRDKAISDTYEPGSVFKIITLSMALNEGVVTKDSTFTCNGSMNVLGRTDPLKCWKTTGHGTETLAEAAQNSCNVAFATIGLKTGAQNFYKYAHAFGFFDLTGIDLPGEAGSQWWPESVFYNKDNLSQLAAASFGQTFNITPIQLITAVSAAANGGNLMKPYIVKDIKDQDGNIVKSNEPTVVRQVISPETSKTVNEILESVVQKGTGKNAYVAGYRIAGKTGTSENVPEEVRTGTKSYIVSFLGYAPANDPQIAILLTLDNPSSSTGLYISGGNMAAPVVGRIFSEVLPYMGIEPQYTDDELKSIDLTVPNVSDLSVADAEKTLKNQGFKVKTVGSGAKITDQLPAANAIVASGTEVIIYAGGSKPTNSITVPDLYGKTFTQAMKALTDAGLYIKSVGASSSMSGVVVSKQSVQAGKTTACGSVVEVTLVDSANLGRY